MLDAALYTEQRNIAEDVQLYNNAAETAEGSVNQGSANVQEQLELLAGNPVEQQDSLQGVKPALKHAVRVGACIAKRALAHLVRCKQKKRSMILISNMRKDTRVLNML
jgi:hypothetical protein